MFKEEDYKSDYLNQGLKSAMKIIPTLNNFFFLYISKLISLNFIIKFYLGKNNQLLLFRPYASL